MNNDKAITLDEAVAAVRQLPKDAQAELAAELMERVEDVSTLDRSHERPQESPHFESEVISSRTGHSYR